MASHRQTTPQVLSRADARAAGIDVRRLAGAGYTKILHDAYVPADVEVTTLLRVQVALGYVDDGAHASHFTAAELWGAWVPEHPNIHITVRRGARRSRRRGIRTHLTIREPEVVEHRGIRLTSPRQTFLDMASLLEMVDLVVLGDSLVRRGLVSPEQLVAAARSSSGQGARCARRAATLVRRGVDSAMETRLRLLVVLAGLPEPVVNHTILHDDGRWRIRFDLSYPQWKVAIEYEGRQHAESPRQWRRDIVRREDTDRLGWLLVLVVADGIYTDPAATLDRIIAALRQRNVTGIRVRSDEWRRHFPGRVAA